MELGDTVVDVIRKDIKNVHLSVHPPTGRVRISAPDHLSDEAIRAFAVGKLAWIRAQQRVLLEQEREPPRDFVDRETHFVWGRRCLLRIVEAEAAPSVEWRPSRLWLSVRPQTSARRRAEVIEAWYRQQLRIAAEPLIARWQQRAGVEVSRLLVQRMKTRWGSCNPRTGIIRLNTQLAKKPLDCLEYVLVHELVHLIDPTHGPHFVALMDGFMPGWRQRRDLLNRLPIPHERCSP